MRQAEKKNLEYRYVRQDISSNCNLRCKFCVHNWKHIPANINMDLAKFKKIIPILPLVQDEGFHFSCRFEPLINPHLLDLLEVIPESCKNKAFLTTNLSKPLSDEFFQKLSKSNLHHINISIETFNPETYKSLCQGGNFEIFFNNLTRLAAIFKNVKNSPKIQFITMILKENYHELIEIAVKCHNDFFADHHEFRTPYPYSLNAIDPAWSEYQLLSRTQLDELSTKLKALPFPICWSMQSDEQLMTGIKKSVCDKHDLDDYDIYAIRNSPVPKSELKEMSRNEDFYDLRIESDGTIYFYGTKEKYHINQILNPDDFFWEKLNQLFEIETSRFQPFMDKKIDDQTSCEGKIHVETFLDYGSFLSIKGWAFLENENSNKYTKILLILNNKKRSYYPVETTFRPDVAEFFKNQNYTQTGFKCMIKKSDFEENFFKIGIIFIPDLATSSQKPACFCEYSDMLVFDQMEIDCCT